MNITKSELEHAIDAIYPPNKDLMSDNTPLHQRLSLCAGYCFIYKFNGHYADLIRESLIELRDFGQIKFKEISFPDLPNTTI